MTSIPFYQTIWNGVNLMQICKDTGERNNCLPSAKFYENYYNIVLSNKDNLSDSWSQQKQIQTAWLKEQLLKYGTLSSKSLSIGAGTGIVELPLIKEGFPIDLHDFQHVSFDHYGAKDVTNCFSCDLSDLGDKSYDIIFSMATTYAMDEQMLKDYLKKTRKLLKPNSIFLWLDTSLSWQEIYSYYRNRKYYTKNCVLWGYKRNLKLWKEFGKDFVCLDTRYYNNQMEEIDVNALFGVPFSPTPAWQLMVLKKND